MAYPFRIADTAESCSPSAPHCHSDLKPLVKCSHAWRKRGARDRRPPKPPGLALRASAPIAVALGESSSYRKEEERPGAARDEKKSKRNSSTSAARRKIAESICRFLPENAEFFGLDNVKLSFSPASFRDRESLRWAWRDLNDEILRWIASNARSPLRFTDAGRAVTWNSKGARHDLMKFGRLTLVVDFNPLRDVRAALPVADQRMHQRFPDNYIETRFLDPAEIRRRCLKRFVARVDEGKKIFSAIASICGVKIAPADVLVSVNVLEMAWDAPTRRELASLGTHLFAESWKRHFYESKETFDLDRLEFGSDGALKGRGKNGVVLKLYQKAGNVLRFEVQLTKRAARKFLGERLDPGDPKEFPRQLNAIGRELYEHLLDVQSEVLIPTAASLGDLLDFFARSGAQRSVLEQLISYGVARPTSNGAYLLLSKMRALGLVAKGPGKGHWSLTPRVAPSARVLRRLLAVEAQ